MPYDGSAWDPTTPTNSTLANEIDDVARDIKIGIQGRMALEHIFPASQTGTSEGGRHSYITLQAQTSVPSMPVLAAVTQAGMLFVSAGNLTFQNSAATTVTLVNSAGKNTIVNAIYSSTGSNGELIIGSSGGALGILAPAATSGLALISSATAAPVWAAFASAITDYGTSTSTGSPVTQSNLKIVYGTISSVGNKSSQVITGLPFANANSYVAFAIQKTTVLAGLVGGPAIVRNNGGQMTVYNASDTSYEMSWMAIGT